MIRAIASAVLLIVAVVALVAQGPDPSRHDKYRDDPKAYCLPGKPMDAHGHECACKMECPDDPNVAPPEDVTCELYCTKARCVCHVDQGCEPRAM